MIPFLRSVLSENGSPSSKRVVLFILVFLFVFLVIWNLCTGKSVSTTLSDQVYYAMLYVVSLIFGSNIVSSIKDIKAGPQNPPL